MRVMLSASRRAFPSSPPLALLPCRQGLAFQAQLLLGDQGSVSEGLARAFKRGFAVPTPTIIALGATLTAEAALSLVGVKKSNVRKRLPTSHLSSMACASAA